MPQISVVMSVYNTECYVGASIESILQQTFGDFEFIIVDDGSTDGSLGVVRRYADKDQRIRVISRPNTGIVGALNGGLAAARGEYIARMDADDLCEATRFDRQLQTMQTDRFLVALGCCGIAVDPDGELLGNAPLPLTHEEIEVQHLKGVSSIYHPAVMMRADAVKQVGGYREGTCPCEDYDLWLRLGEIGKLANLPEPLFTWRRTATGIVASKAAVMESTVERVLRDAWARRALPGQPAVPRIPVTRIVDLYQQWGWMALKNGHLRTGRRYARRAILANPWQLSTWRLAACALRGR